ncbi:MAG TPA: diphthine--ammonia ligase [Chitinophagaceae bacterium]|nr:diphthine--ammonia ligase [Chitinophagaceae bacterium]
MALPSYINWSGGKDSGLAFYHTFSNNELDVKFLLTNLSEQHRRVTMHGVREQLLDQQAAAIGLPIRKLFLKEPVSNIDYEEKNSELLSLIKDEGCSHGIFGDIFLEDLRQYREAQLRKAGLQASFPLWGKDTFQLMCEFIELGFKAIVVCVKAELLPISFTGRVIDADFLKDLPENIDPCGENGEFHSFVFDGPIFSNPVKFKIGEKFFQEYNAPRKDFNKGDDESVVDTMGFWVCDLLPHEETI